MTKNYKKVLKKLADLIMREGVKDDADHRKTLQLIRVIASTYTSDDPKVYQWSINKMEELGL